MTQGASEADLILLCAEAKKLGAIAAARIAAGDIVIDERQRLKCLVPRCPNYGTLMCPPNVVSIPEFKRILSNYHDAILFQIAVPYVQEDTKVGKASLADLAEKGEYDKRLRSLLFPRMYDILDALEAKAFSLGYRFAAALGAARCYICEKCPREGPCKAPFRGRPSIQAMGIDVMETARKAGLTIEPPGQGKIIFTCLLLVD